MTDGEMQRIATRPHAVYKHFDANGQLLYIGVSLNHFARLAQHSDTSHWFNDIARIEVIACATRADALAKERSLIRAERPKHNKQHNRDQLVVVDRHAELPPTPLNKPVDPRKPKYGYQTRINGAYMLRAKQLSALLRVDEKELAMWRRDGCGPTFLRYHNGGPYLYPCNHVVQWMEVNEFSVDGVTIIEKSRAP